MFRFLDETINLMLPKAEVRFTSMIASGQVNWRDNPFCQEAFVRISQLIEMRKHIDFDSYRPLRSGWMENDMTHMKDWDSIDHWVMILRRFT